MNGPEIEFDWDEANIGHVARHSVLPEEAEQVILNDPVGTRCNGVRTNQTAHSVLLPGTREVMHYG